MKVTYLKNETKRIIFFFKFIIIILINPILLTDCDYNTPILDQLNVMEGIHFHKLRQIIAI